MVILLSLEENTHSRLFEAYETNIQFQTHQHILKNTNVWCFQLIYFPEELWIVDSHEQQRITDWYISQNQGCSEDSFSHSGRTQYQMENCATISKNNPGASRSIVEKLHCLVQFWEWIQTLQLGKHSQKLWQIMKKLAYNLIPGWRN